MPLSDDLNRNRLKRSIDKLYVEIPKLEHPTEKRRALKQLDDLTLSYLQALCAEMKYVFQQTSILQTDLLDATLADPTEEPMNPLLLQETYADVVQRLGWNQPEAKPRNVADLVPEEEVKFDAPEDRKYYVEVQIENWGRNHDRFHLLDKMTLEVTLWQEWVEEYLSQEQKGIRHPGIEGRCSAEIEKILGVQPALISVQVLRATESNAR